MFSAPNHVNFLLTHRCNLHCNYCYVPFTSYPEELSTTRVCTIIDLLYEQGVFSLDLTGGEPTMREDITDILRYCNDLDMDVGLATNGVLLTPEKIEELGRAWDRKKTIHMSIDAATPEKYFQITGSRDFFTVLESTKALLAYDLDVIWNFVYTLETREELVPVCDLACELGVKKMFVLPVIEVGRAQNIQFSFNQLQAFLLTFPEVERKFPSIRFRVTPATPLDFLVPLLEAGWTIEKILNQYPYARTPLQDEKYRDMRTTGCIGGVGRWAVTAQGDVFPCELLTCFSSMRCGNLLKHTFQECLQVSSVLLDIPVDQIDDCAECKYVTICGGGCRARAFMKYGDPGMPDPLCPFHSGEHSKKRIRKGDNAKSEIQCNDHQVFSIHIDDDVLRVRKESFGGIAYLLTREKQIYVNDDGFTFLEILQHTQDIQEIMEELEKRGISFKKTHIVNFLENFFQIVNEGYE